MIKNYFKTAWRNLRKSKVYSFINITGLAIGLASCMLIILYTRDEISFDRFHDNAANIYHVVSKMTSTDGRVTKMGSTGNRPGPAFKESLPETTGFLRIQQSNFNVKKGTDVFDEEGHYADDNFFTFFSFPLKAGNPATALSDIHSIVINETLAKKYFGDENAVGKILEIDPGNGFEQFVVSGVAKNPPENSSVKVKLLLSNKIQLRDNPDNMWLNFFQNTFISLQPGADIKAVEKKFAQVYAASAKDEIIKAAEDYGLKEKFEYKLQPLTKMHLDTEYVPDNGLYNASNPVYAYILSGIALFLLLIACINFVNLSIARSLNRAKEIGIRKVAGGERRQLIVQFLGESFMLSFFAFAFALLLVELALPFFNELSNKALSFSYLFDIKLILLYTGLFIVSGLLAGFYPALVLSKLNPVETLYGKTRFARSNYLSKGLVVVQFALATFLIIGTVIIYSQFNFLASYSIGYNDDDLAIVYTGPVDAKKANLIAEEFKKNPSILSVAARNGGERGTRAKVNGKEIDLVYETVDREYLPTLQLKLLQGHNIKGENPADSATSILVNETFVKEAGWKEPLGQKVDFFWDSARVYNVVGVVKDFYYGSLKEGIKPQLFAMDRRGGSYGQLWVKINPLHSASALQYIQKTFRHLLPQQPYQYEFKKDINAAQYAAEQKWKQIISFAAGLTIFISCIGLFGLATLSAQKRTKEIGIRKVLGAGLTGIVKKLSIGFIALVLMAALIAMPAAWWVSQKWLQNYPLRIELSVWMFALALVLIVLVSFLTICFQAIKAAIANPVKSLRTE
ncbi:MAG TPA: ABC transporter permease [Ferruginibacter sp.]|nr:ABC transporter permease [Ferruginibacter sp.]